MNTVISGEYDEVMFLLVQTIKPFVAKYPSVFTLKIANACKSCKNETNERIHSYLHGKRQGQDHCGIWTRFEGCRSR